MRFCPSADTVGYTHGIVPDKVGVLTDLNGERSWITGRRRTMTPGGNGSAALWNAISADVELVPEALPLGPGMVMLVLRGVR